MSILGAKLCWALVQEQSLQSVMDYSIKQDMLNGVSQEIFEFIVNFHGKHGTVPQRETVLEEIELEKEFILTPSEPSSFYAQKVRDRAAFKAQREIIKELGAATKERDIHGIDAAAKRLVHVGSIQFNLGDGEIVDTKKRKKERWEAYLKAKAAEDGVTGIRTPWEPLNEVTAGWQPGDFIIICGRPGTGKTFIALICALLAEKEGKHVGVISREMTTEEIEQRRDALKFQLPALDLRRGELDSGAESRYKELLDDEPEDPPWEIVTGGKVEDVPGVQAFVTSSAVDFLVIDGVYLLKDVEAGKNTSRHERIGNISRGIKDFAVNRKIPIIGTTQLNRARGTQAGADTDALSFSDELSMDASVIIALRQENERLLVRLIKNRGGPMIEFFINWDLLGMDFSLAFDNDEEEEMDDPQNFADAQEAMF